MESEVIAFELRDDKTVKTQPLSLTFPRPNGGRLYVVTNQRSNCHFLQNPEEQRSFHKASGIGKNSEEKKKLFQYGVSTKVFSVTDPTGTKWEVCLLLSPSEISRLSSVCNLIGYLSTCLVCRESRQAFQKVIDGKNSAEAAEEICLAIAPFLCLPLEGDTVRDFCTQLSNILNEACKDLRRKEEMMVAGGLAALVAAELAASMMGSDMFDYTGENTQSQESQKDQIHQMVAAFDVQAERLAISHQEKTVHVIFRNPCPDNWASGGRKRVESGETFEFGLCHKTFSISEEQSEIQFLQSLQESYDMIAVFYTAAFAERLLMTTKWRNTLEDLLKEGRKETINELSQLATKFICSKKCNTKIFLKYFRKEMTEICLKVKTLQGGGEVICVLGVLVAIKAALKAKSIADKPMGDINLSSDEDAEKPVAPGDTESEVAPDCKNTDVPNTQESGYPKPQTIGPNLEANDTTLNEEEATCNIGGISRGLADGLGNEDMECPASLEHVDIRTSSLYPDDVSHPRPIEMPLNDQLDLNAAYPSVESDLSETSVGHVHDTESDSKTTYNEDAIDNTLSRPTPMLESSDADTKKRTYQVEDGSGGEYLTFDSQNYPSNKMSHKTDVDQVGQRQDHPSDIDQGREDTSNRRGATSSFLMLLIIVMVALAIASFMLPSRLTTVLFTGLALILGLWLFLGRRP